VKLAVVLPGATTRVPVDVFGGLGIGWHVKPGQQRVFVVEQALLGVTAAQNDRASVPWVIMQVAVVILAHDVVDTNRPWNPAYLTLTSRWVVRVEQPPTAHIHLGAVGGHDVKLWGGALGAGYVPGRNRWAREQLGDHSPE
jgi:hypothetical protein